MYAKTHSLFSNISSSLKYQILNTILFDMINTSYELQVTSYKLRVESLKT